MEHHWVNGSATFSEAELGNIAGGATDLLATRSVPVRFFHYFWTDGSIERLTDGNGRSFVRFGFTRGDELICLALDDLSILQIWPHDLSILTMVNSDLDNFLGFMALCEERYPYYTDEGEGDFEVFIEASERLNGELAQIDSGALAPGSYWSNFLADVSNGDYAETVDE
jgi:hypothetical protein